MSWNNDLRPYNDVTGTDSLQGVCAADASTMAHDGDSELNIAYSQPPAFSGLKGGAEKENRHVPRGGKRDAYDEKEEDGNEDNVGTNTNRTCCGLECALCNVGLSVSQHALGVILILCVTVIWVASSAWIQYIFGELEYEKPYFLTYFNTAGFSLWNLCYIFSPAWRRVPWEGERRAAPLLSVGPAPGKEPRGAAAAEDSPRPLKAAEGTNSGEWTLPSRKHQRGQAERLPAYSKVKIFKCACAFCPLWFMANYLFNLSLPRTSIASVTVLSSTSSIWTLILSVLFLKQRLTLMKIGSVLLCVSGSMMIASTDSNNTVKDSSVVGDIFAIISAFFYAAYTTVLKWCLPEDERFHMGMVFGMVGVINLLVFWVGIPIINATGIEIFQLPTLQQLWPIILNTLIGTNLSDVLWARSVVLTSPVVATLGLSLTTPLAMIVDAVWKHAVFSPLYITGAFLVMTGFLFVNLDFGGMSTEGVRRCWVRVRGMR